MVTLSRAQVVALSEAEADELEAGVGCMLWLQRHGPLRALALYAEMRRVAAEVFYCHDHA
eukprot:CAMPEP_0173262138 /NCGR_PEP_ID=MMETSP1142-20121109/26603_1 /TAXON_ID=483371 /ORGANISM="non described non described, Strain CCMP2298" /LENGTH=59 /DNA_ID=CAMNT_0014197233 /DNA_START=5 /DNA_END=184 /DNA_ORIENTATION=+